MLIPKWQMLWVAGKPSPTHQNTACWICHANQNGTWHALCSFPFHKIYFKCLPCALFWKLTFQMHQCKLRRDPLPIKTLWYREFQQILLGKLEKQLLQLATVGSRSLQLLWSLFRKTPSVGPCGEVLATCHSLIFIDYVCKQWICYELGIITVVFHSFHSTIKTFNG